MVGVELAKNAALIGFSTFPQGLVGRSKNVIRRLPKFWAIGREGISNAPITSTNQAESGDYSS